MVNINALEIIEFINKEEGLNFTVINSDFKVKEGNIIQVENNNVTVSVKLSEGKMEIV